jgi:hypothetical protein
MLLFALLVPVSAQASMQDVRVLASGIDRSSAKAEQLAISYAKQRAVYLVARKWPLDDPAKQLAKFTREDWNDVVRGATVLQLKRQGDVTYADVTVTVIDSALRSKLGVKAVDVAPTNGRLRNVLALPVYISDGTVMLWNKENPLRTPLYAELMRQGHGRVMVPSGDLDDLRLIDQNNALTVKTEDMAAMRKRYGADEIVIAIYNAKPTKPTELPSILLRRLDAVGARSEAVPLPAQAKDQKPAARLQQVVRLAAGAIVQIASASGDEERARLLKATKVPVTFQYANPRELAQMQLALRDSPGVLMVEYPAIALGGPIEAIAYYEGEAQKLREKLSKDAIIVRQKDQRWHLSYR